MHIKLRTKVNQDFETVFEGFNEKLFMELVPPGMKLELKEFGGSNVGDAIRLKATILGIISQDWYNVITESEEHATENFFVDEGVKMPFPIKSWRHKHRIVSDGDGSEIVDEISFSSGLWLVDILLYPIMYAQFAYRKPIYKRFFSGNLNSDLAKAR